MHHLYIFTIICILIAPTYSSEAPVRLFMTDAGQHETAAERPRKMAWAEEADKKESDKKQLAYALYTHAFNAHMQRRLHMELAQATRLPAASNNALSIIAEMKAALLMQRIATGKPHAFTALQAIECATIEGARAIHISDNIGSLEPGKKADIISIQLDSLHQIPVYDPISTLVFATYPSDVQTVIINGKVHLLHGEFTYAESLIKDVYKHVETYKQKIAAHIPT